eukprot:CAMPEP_0176230312 /NCGR_PEP_ID=MMETSP0121_2-20121125/24235_1 /TAXON_ID=160619 /ORGANISM="Kryptoperidinium foliaceum, Strain CCMP 1326" /LENGTH=231 /DNA_ID=CAMNT_0017569653 /DNA_START=49 /DNA_END=740 /DNA_ORIENTATION=-
MPFPLLCCCAADGAADGADVVVPHIESALGMDESPTPMYDFRQAARREPCGHGAPIVLARKQPDFPWGVELEMTPEKDVLIIASIRDQVGEFKTPMGVHNFSVPDEAQVLPGDCVVKVNDKSDAASMIRLMQTETELTLTTKRPVVHKTVVLKRGMPLGLSLKFVDSGGGYARRRPDRRSQRYQHSGGDGRGVEDERDARDHDRAAALKLPPDHVKIIAPRPGAASLWSFT